MNKNQFSAIILSAGYSSRMGKFKPLLHLDNKTVVEYNVNNFKESGIENINVIVGYKKDEIIKHLDNINTKYIINDNYSEGMFSSVLCGVRNIDENTRAFFINPVDIPLIKKSTIEKMLKLYDKYKPKVICPSFCGIQGHPVLLSHEMRNVILNYKNPKQGLRSILSNYKNQTLIFKSCDHGTILDMDNIYAYEKIKEYCKLRKLPDYLEIKSILETQNISQAVIEHGKAVANVATKIANKLSENGVQLDIPLIQCSALLHDIGKGEHNHAQVGAKIISKYGYENIAHIIVNHMDLCNYNNCNSLNEEQILYLADKVVKETQIVTLEQRFDKSFKIFRNSPVILENVLRRYNAAKSIKNNIQNVINQKLDSVLKK